AKTPYHYSSYDEETEVAPRTKPAVIILGSGPNRIGQGIEFDYSCVHASLALSEAGYETVMVNCNPETVSTDYDTSDRLYFEPLSRSPMLRRSPPRSVTRSWCDRPTCSADAGCRSSTTTTRCGVTSRLRPRSVPTGRCWSTGSSTTRSRSTWTPCTTAPTCSS